MLLDERRTLYDLLRSRASPDLKSLVEKSILTLTGVGPVDSGRLLSRVSSKTLLSRLSKLLETLRHPFDNSQIRVCIVDFLATVLEIGSCHHVVIIPEALNGVTLPIDEDYDIIVIHGVDALPAGAERYWVDALRSVIGGAGAVSIMLDALHHSYGDKWGETDRGIAILKGPMGAQNSLGL